MKHTFVVLIICIGCTQASVPKRESDREHDGFVGLVKKVFVVWSPISGSNYPVGSRCRQMTNVYDESGRLMQHSVYPSACGSDEIRDDYSYDLKRRLIEITGYDGDGQISDRRVYSYSGDDRVPWVRLPRS